MKRIALASLVPPFAVCRYGCAGCCAAPIGVFWLAGIIAIVYGFMGGPAQMATTSWGTLGLGIGLWVIAATWAATVIRGVDADKADPKCSGRRSTICQMASPNDDDQDPMSDIKKLSL